MRYNALNVSFCFLPQPAQLSVCVFVACCCHKMAVVQLFADQLVNPVVNIYSSFLLFGLCFQCVDLSYSENSHKKRLLVILQENLNQKFKIRLILGTNSEGHWILHPTGMGFRNNLTVWKNLPEDRIFKKFSQIGNFLVFNDAPERLMPPPGTRNIK